MKPESAKPKPARPQPRQGTWLFALFFILIASGIALTVLLANDMSHLRSVYRWLNIEWPFDRQPMKTLRLSKSNRLRSLPVRLPEPWREPVVEAKAGAFLRLLEARGPQMCGHFAGLGIANDGWKVSQFDARVYECEHVTTLEPAHPGERRPSLFFTARGNAAGDVSTVRMKLVAPPGDGGRQMHEVFVRAVTSLIEDNRWNDLAGVVDAARDLTDFKAAGLGLSLTLIQEPTSPGSYNLVLVPNVRDPALRRTLQYFDDDKRLPQPRSKAELAPSEKWPKLHSSF